MAKPQVSLSTLQSLNRRLLLHTQHHGLIGRGEINPHQIDGLGRKLRVSRDTPTVPPLQADAVTGQHSPDLAGRHAPQSLGQQTAAPAGVTRKGRLIQQVQDPAFYPHAVTPEGAGPRPILQAHQPLDQETSTPLAHCARPYPKPLRNPRGRGSGGRRQNQLRSQNQQPSPPVGVSHSKGTGWRTTKGRRGFHLRDPGWSHSSLKLLRVVEEFAMLGDEARECLEAELGKQRPNLRFRPFEIHMGLKLRPRLMGRRG